MARQSIEQLKKLFDDKDQKGGGGGNFGDYYPFWNMEFGKRAVIRFLPDKNEDNPLGFLIEKVVHKLPINGEEKQVPCLSMYNKDCPVCKVSQSFYKSNDDEQGKIYWRKKQNLARVLVIEDPLPANDDGETHEGQVRNISLNFTIFNIIKEAIKNQELAEWPDEFVGGCNFIISKTKQGPHASYVTSKFERDYSDLDEDQIEFVTEKLIDISSLLPQEPNVEKIEAMLQASLTGESYVEDGDDDDNAGEEDDVPVAKKPAATKPSLTKPSAKKTTPSKNNSPEEPVTTGDSDPDDILAQIRQRRAGNK